MTTTVNCKGCGVSFEREKPRKGHRYRLYHSPECQIASKSKRQYRNGGKEKLKALVESRKATGLCVKCGGPRDQESSRCKACSRKHSIDTHIRTNAKFWMLGSKLSPERPIQRLRQLRRFASLENTLLVPVWDSVKDWILENIELWYESDVYHIGSYHPINELRETISDPEALGMEELIDMKREF